MWRLFFMALVSVACADFSQILCLSVTPPFKEEVLWKEEKVRPFDELILSWNGLRPEKGKWLFWVSLRQDGQWSPWLLYAEWASQSQKTFRSNPVDSFAASYQDAAYPTTGLCDAFQIKVTAEEGADLTALESLFASLSSLKEHKVAPPPKSLGSVFLSNPPLQSQMVLRHPRAKDLCSPTSTTTAINLLLGYKKIDPVLFADRIHDDAFDIYGNWILNTAQAFCELGGAYLCHVERLNDFAALHSYLLQGLPVVVSVRGSLPGGPVPYTAGHLICVVGYDAKEERVYCVDSGFAETTKTFVSYPLVDFLNAWGLRQNIAYLFPLKGKVDRGAS